MASVVNEVGPLMANSGRNWSWGGGYRERMKNLLQTSFLSDATLIVGPSRKPFKVHRLILESGSPVFHERFKATTNNEIIIPDVESNIFSLFLGDLYYGDSQIINDSCFEESEFLTLLKLSSDFQVINLTDIYARILKKELCDENVVDVFQKSMECGHKELIQSCLVHFCKNAWKLVEAEEFVNLRQECLYEILKRDDLMVFSELQLYKSLIRWGEAECDRQNMEPSDLQNLRKVLQKLLGLIRFPMMPQADFTLNVGVKTILNLDELVSILLYFTVPLQRRSAIPSGKFNSTPRRYYVEGSNPTGFPYAIRPTSFKMLAYRHNTSLEWKSGFVRQKREVLRFAFEVDGNTTINLEGFICKLYRDPVHAACFNGDWRNVYVQYGLYEEINDGRHELIMGETMNVDSTSWNFNFAKHIPISGIKSYRLTVEISGLIKFQDTNNGAVHHVDVNQFLLTAGIGYMNVCNLEWPSGFKVYFGREKGTEAERELPINQGFIDALIFST